MNAPLDVLAQLEFARKEAEQAYKVLCHEISELEARLEALKNQKKQMEKGLKIEGEIHAAPKQGHGVLQGACLRALESEPSGLKGRQVKEWIIANEPDINPNSAPAVLARLRANGIIKKSQLGFYSLNN
jgi:hypothetical protein